MFGSYRSTGVFLVTGMPHLYEAHLEGRANQQGANLERAWLDSTALGVVPWSYSEQAWCHVLATTCTWFIPCLCESAPPVSR